MAPIELLEMADRAAANGLLTVTNAFAVLHLLPMSDRDKDVETLAPRHQITVLERQFGNQRAQFSPGDRAFLAALLHGLKSEVLCRVRLVVRSDARRSPVCARPASLRSEPRFGSSASMTSPLDGASTTAAR
jgi:putative transposase